MVLDPRNDPRKPEYWDIRTRRQSQDQIKFEEAFNQQGRKKEKMLIRKGLIALALGNDRSILLITNIFSHIRFVLKPLDCHVTCNLFRNNGQ